MLDPHRELFQHFDWIASWVRAYKKDRRLCVAAVFDATGVKGFLPLVFENRILRFAGYSVADYNGLICDPECAAQVLEVALDALLRIDGWDRIVLDNVQAHSPLAASLGVLSSRIRRRLEVIRGIPCPALVLTGQKERILNGILAKSRRKVNALQRLGQVRFRHIEDTEELKSHLPAFYRQHINRWAVDGIRSRFMDKESLDFYEGLLARPHIRNHFRFSILEVNDRPAAYLMGIEVNGKYSFYKPTFDIDLWDHSPGLVLLFSLFQYLKTTEINEFDFGLGGEAYKYRFSNVIRQNLDIHIRRPGFKATVSRFGLLLKERVRNQPLVTPIWFKTTERLHRFLAKTSWSSIRRSILPSCETLWVLSPPQGNTQTGDLLSPRRAQLSDLAGLSRQYPEYFDRVRLQQARVRLQAGEIPYIVSFRGALRWLVWVRGTLSKEGAAIYDIWSPPGAPAGEGLSGFPELLTVLASEHGLSGWKLHLDPHIAPVAIFRKVGFSRAARLLRVRMFRSFSFTLKFKLGRRC